MNARLVQIWLEKLHEKTEKCTWFSPHESSLWPSLDITPATVPELQDTRTRDTSFYYLQQQQQQQQPELSGKKALNYESILLRYFNVFLLIFFSFFSQESLLWLVI